MIMNIREVLKRQKPLTIRDEVYKHIRKKILTGEIGEGNRLVEAKLSKEIGSSRTPVREALHKLEMENLIYSIPRIGYVVRSLTEKEVEEICDIRLALETLAVKWGLPNIKSRELARLEKIILLTEEHIEKNQTNAVVQLDTEFHDLLCKASKSWRIEEICQSLMDRMLKLRMDGLCIPEVAYRSNEGHRRILQAVKRKNIKEIESAYRFHLAGTKKNIIDLIRKRGSVAEPG